MDIVDREILAAGREASIDYYRQREQSGPEVERTATASSASTSSSERSITHEEISLNRVPTQRDLERQTTVLSRIQTARSQHSATVGKSLRSRDSRRPLPNFGAGKPYPPPLPEREEYVVEFDGPDDPLHAQNWPIKKKYVYPNCICRLILTALEGYTRRRCLHLQVLSRHSLPVYFQLRFHKLLRNSMWGR